jgi:hypothetical protein
LTAGAAAPRLVSLTAAPFVSYPVSSCDPRVAYVVVLRPPEEEQSGAGGTIHAHSPRRAGPFIGVNCGALPGELLESHRWNRVATARALGVSRATLWRRMREARL